MPAVLFAQFVFRHRGTRWHSFNVPHQFAEIFHCKQWLLRKPVQELKPWQRELTLLVRLLFIMYKEFPQVELPGLRRMMFHPHLPFKWWERLCVLRMVCRRLIQSDFVYSAQTVLIVPESVTFDKPRCRGFIGSTVANDGPPLWSDIKLLA